ncbi:MAG: mevalonate kinase [Phycisphaerae bacterium]
MYLSAQDGETMAETDMIENVPLFVPGRLCLFGEHSDWAGQYGLHPGYCLVIGTDQGFRAEVHASDMFTVETLIPDEYGRPSGRTRQMSCDWRAETLLAAARDENEFFRYCAGVAHQMMEHPGVTGGIHLRIRDMDLPLRKGVSSSAAVCILVARAFEKVYDLGMFPHELMEAAYRGERLTGSQCGRMDQACVYGKTPVLLTFGKGDVRVEPLFPRGRMDMFFVDLAGQKDTVRILSDLQGAYLSSKDLQKALGQANEEVIRRAYRAITEGDSRLTGELMTRAQDTFERLIAPHSPAELRSPRLHQVLGLQAISEHVYGGKGVGSQGDGTAQFVARSAEDRAEAMRKIVEAFPEMRCFPLTIYPQNEGDSHTAASAS